MSSWLNKTHTRRPLNMSIPDIPIPNTRMNIVNTHNSRMNIINIHNARMNTINKNKGKPVNHIVTIMNRININVPEDSIAYCVNLYNLTTFSKNGKYVAVMLESRFCDIKILLIQVSRFLSSEWSVMLYVTSNVYDNYKKLAEEFNNIQVFIIEYPLTSVTDYNNILLDVSFWEKFISFSKILIFQSDTMIYKYGIENFLKFDYVGAPWPTSLGIQGGNGGLSLRSIQPSIECLKIDEIKIPQYAQYDINQKRLGRQPEDIVFALGMKQLGYNVATNDSAKHFSIESVEFNKNVFGSHRLDVFNKTLHNELYINSIIPYYYENNDIGGHRFGWNFVNSYLFKNFCNKNGVYLNAWLDCDYVMNNKNSIPENKDWIGITHLTPFNTNIYYNECNINKLLKNKLFINDLKRCKGIFTLSTYMKIHLKDILLKLGHPNIIVDNLYHPVGYTNISFNPDIRTNTILFIGSQLRRISTIYKLNTTLNKIWLSGRSQEDSIHLLQQECKEYNIYITPYEKKSVTIQRLSDSEYDHISMNSYIVIDLYDASANNALVECISRNIPCFVTKLPAIKEYIGDDYPLLFTNIKELESMLLNTELILSGYNYLKERPHLKERLKIDNFMRDILNSDITKSLCNNIF